MFWSNSLVRGGGMDVYQQILLEFENHFRGALKEHDKVGMRSLVEAFRETWEGLPLQVRQGTYKAYADTWEKIITYFGTHPEVGDDLKQVLIHILEESTPVPT